MRVEIAGLNAYFGFWLFLQNLNPVNMLFFDCFHRKNTVKANFLKFFL